MTPTRVPARPGPVAAALLCLLVAAPLSHAETSASGDADKAADTELRPKWELGVGTVLYTQPDYIGSDEYRFRYIPFPWIVYRGERLRADRESIQTKIFGTERVRLDLSTSGQISVDSDKNDLRKGMPDVDWTFQLGPSLTFLLARSDDHRASLELDIPIRPSFAIDWDHFSYEGFAASPQLEYKLSRSPYQFTAQLGLEFNDQEFNDFFYGVGGSFATADRPAYRAEGGYAGVRAAAGIARYFGRFYVGVFTRYYNLDGAAFEDSPLTNTSHCFVGGIALGVVLMKSDEMVSITESEPRSSGVGGPGTVMPAHDDVLDEPPPQQ